jgi:hypothetical protein
MTFTEIRTRGEYGRGHNQGLTAPGGPNRLNRAAFTSCSGPTSRSTVLWASIVGLQAAAVTNQQHPLDDPADESETTSREIVDLMPAQ